ncbi:MAG TPA: hypothetical protein VM658_07110 [bacterium]|nr:hypothetical protein [bacterium]
MDPQYYFTFIGYGSQYRGAAILLMTAGLASPPGRRSLLVIHNKMPVLSKINGPENRQGAKNAKDYF